MFCRGRCVRRGFVEPDKPVYSLGQTRDAVASAGAGHARQAAVSLHGAGRLLVDGGGARHANHFVL